jgi:hypothetical protein
MARRSVAPGPAADEGLQHGQSSSVSRRQGHGIGGLRDESNMVAADGRGQSIRQVERQADTDTDTETRTDSRGDVTGMRDFVLMIHIAVDAGLIEEVRSLSRVTWYPDTCPDTQARARHLPGRQPGSQGAMTPRLWFACPPPQVATCTCTCVYSVLLDGRYHYPPTQVTMYLYCTEYMYVFSALWRVLPNHC